MASEEKISEYAAALSTLLETTPLEKIRVNDICKQCGTDRQNFYHYFKDKYDLATWIYKLDYIEIIGKYSNSYSVKQLTELLERIQSKSEIYINLFRDASQNSLYSVMITAESEMFLQVKKEQTGASQLSSEEKFDLTFDITSIYELMLEWVLGGYSVSACQLAELIWQLSSDYVYDHYKNRKFKAFL